MARRYTELVRRYGEPMQVSTIMRRGSEPYDAVAPYPVHRQPFDLRTSKLFPNQMRWARWLIQHCRSNIDVIHCGEIRPVGYAVWWTHRRARLPYVLYVNGGDLLAERRKTQQWIKKYGARRMFGDAIGVVANSVWCAELARQVMSEVGVTTPPPVATIELGTDPTYFHPSADTGRLRAQWGIGDAPVMLTVARLVDHKGQDTAIRAFAALRHEFPTLHYVIVGEGVYEAQLHSLATALQVHDRVHFVGALSDDQLREVYATATVYVGLSRLDRGVNIEGFGISFVEASASGVPIVAGDSGGVRSAVREGETGVLVPPADASAAVRAIASILRDPKLRACMSQAGRHAVESYYNWDRVARQTREFVAACLASRAGHTGHDGRTTV